MKLNIQAEFEKRFGSGASFYASPGRVNLIGDHTDYNLGYVLPASIDKAIYVALKPAAGRMSSIYSLDYDSQIEVDLSGPEKPQCQWGCYVYGVAQEMIKRGAKIGAVKMVFGGDVPLGAGLSSSAALESAVGFALNDIFSLGFSREDLARIGQMTEHNYIGVRCGIMDQFASLMGRAGYVIRLDCRSLDYTLFPFEPQGCRVVLVDSMVKHSLASSEYNIRRAQCEEGVKAIAGHVSGVCSLRDVTAEMLDRYRGDMSETVYRRCSYVIEENQRLLDGCEALQDGDYETFGRKMFGSHYGLSRQYEVSCRELDFIVDIAHSTSGVLGARMMGGGFGGCVISMVRDNVYDAYMADVKEKFEREFGIEPRAIDVIISDGAHKMD